MSEDPCRAHLTKLRQDWSDCKRCDLAKGRHKLVFGEGNPRADILIVGEAPGATENMTGLPFQGDAGKVLDRFLDNMKLDRRTDLYITNVVCCRPTMEVMDERTGEIRLDNRPPNKAEREACRPRLLETVYLVDPMIIIAVGKVPYQALLGKASKVASVRGKMQTMHLAGRYTDLRYAVMPMYHTAFLLRTHDNRSEGPWGRTWDDWAIVCSVIDHLREAYYGTPQPDRVE
jgi:uracil-DNA glycosylase family 4